MEKITNEQVEEMIALCSHAERLGIKTLTVEPGALVVLAQEIKILRQSVGGNNSPNLLLKVRGYGWDECAEKMSTLPAVCAALKEANPYLK